MSDRIYRVGTTGLTPLSAEPFAEEKDLEELIAAHPDLIGEDDRHWILVRRQQGIAEAEDAAERWAVDLLLLDQDAVPTLVEVKRGQSRELRRAVVGQMLEYAANAAYVRVEELREAFEESARAGGHDPTARLAELLEDEDEAADYWERVRTNLKARKLRLLFVADHIPSPLARIVGFLNEQMPDVDVSAVEVKQFRAGESQTLVPTVIGRDSAPPAKPGSAKAWTRRTFPDAFQNPEHGAAARRLLDAAGKAGGTFLGYRSGISIRTRVRDIPLTIAWLLAPGRESSWQPVREFAFGAGNANNSEFFEALPDDLRARLKAWAGEFADDDFAHKDPREILQTAGVAAWCVSYDDAVENIDVLAERLERVLADLKAL